MIHPPSWRSNGNYNTNVMARVREILKSIDMEWLAIQDKPAGQKNFGSMTRYDIYVARKSNTPGFVTKIRGEDGIVFSACIKEMDFIPNRQSRVLERIISKEGDNRVDWIYSPSKYEIRKEWMHHVTNEKTAKHIYPCIYTVSKVNNNFNFRYSSTMENLTKRDDGKPHFGVPKVIFGISHESGIPKVDRDGIYGMTQFAAAIADDVEKLDYIAKAMNCERFRSAMKAVQFTSEDWNRNIIPLLRRDFWKEFVNMDGKLIDEEGGTVLEFDDGNSEVN